MFGFEDYITLMTKNQYRIGARIERDATTRWLSALVAVEEPDGTVSLEVPVTRDKLIEKGPRVLGFLYRSECNLEEEEIEVIKNELLELFKAPSQIVEVADKAAPKMVFERLKEFVYDNNYANLKNGEIIEKGGVSYIAEVYIKGGLGYIRTSAFEKFITLNKELGWSRLEVLKLLKRNNLLITGKGRVYDKKIKIKNTGIYHYIVDITHNTEEEKNE